MRFTILLIIILNGGLRRWRFGHWPLGLPFLHPREPEPAVELLELWVIKPWKKLSIDKEGRQTTVIFVAGNLITTGLWYLGAVQQSWPVLKTFALLNENGYECVRSPYTALTLLYLVQSARWNLLRQQSPSFFAAETATRFEPEFARTIPYSRDGEAYLPLLQKASRAWTALLDPHESLLSAPKQFVRSS